MSSDDILLDAEERLEKAVGVFRDRRLIHGSGEYSGGAANQSWACDRGSGQHRVDEHLHNHQLPWLDLCSADAGGYALRGIDGKN